MRNETAEAKKGTWKRGRRCTPGQRHKEEAKPGQLLPQKGKGGRNYVQVLQLANKSREGERENKPIKEEEKGAGRQGKASFEASCQFQTNHSVYVLLAPPRRSSSPQQTIFLILLNQEVLRGIVLFTQHLANSRVRLADLSQGRRGGLRTALVRAAPQGCPEAPRRDGVCRSFVVPASDRRSRVLPV